MMHHTMIQHTVGWRPLLLPSSVDSSMDKSSPQNPENITTGDLINTSAAVLIADAEIIPQSDAPTDVKGDLAFIVYKLRILPIYVKK